MSKLIGIEGSSYVGKTTVANELSEMGYGVIPEYDTFGPFPELDGSVTGFKYIINELLDRERQRSELIMPHIINFEDRSPVSLITFEDMKILHANTSEQEKIHTEVRDYAISKIIQLYEAGKIHLPDGTAVLRMTSKQGFEDRVKKRGVTAVSEFAIFATQLHMAQKSIEYADFLSGKDSSVVIDVDAKSPQFIAEELINFAKRIYN